MKCRGRFFCQMTVVGLTTILVLSTLGMCYAMTPLGYALKGKECMEQGLCDEAIEHFTKAIETKGFADKELASLYNNRGIAYGYIKRYDKAREDLETAMKLDPLGAFPIYNMSCLYALANSSEEACLWLKKAIEKGYNDWEHIRTDATLDNIRNAACYKEIMAGR